MADNGYNPLRWDCQTQGCFNKKKRPHIEMFADCLPGKIAIGDVDGLVEVSGNLLFLEFKEHSTIPCGQRILYQRLTRFAPAVVMVIEANIERMEISGVNYVIDGEIKPQTTTDLDKLKNTIKRWAVWAGKNPAWKNGWGKCDAGAG